MTILGIGGVGWGSNDFTLRLSRKIFFSYQRKKFCRTRHKHCSNTSFNIHIKKGKATQYSPVPRGCSGTMESVAGERTSTENQRLQESSDRPA